VACRELIQNAALLDRHTSYGAQPLGLASAVGGALVSYLTLNTMMPNKSWFYKRAQSLNYLDLYFTWQPRNRASLLRHSPYTGAQRHCMACSQWHVSL